MRPDVCCSISSPRSLDKLRRWESSKGERKKISRYQQICWPREFFVDFSEDGKFPLFFCAIRILPMSLRLVEKSQQ